MKVKNKLLSMILALAVFAAVAFSLPLSAAAAEGFAYIHDPMDNSSAMKDIVRDENAVYGFRPSESGSLKQYAGFDWSDAALVAAGREERIAYHNSIAIMYDTLSRMQSEGKTAEEIARAMSKMRNDIRIESYKDDPEGLAMMKARNLEKYGHEEGPLPEELYEQYGSWEKVTEKAFSTNVGMDACLGLYDDYYFLYVALGQIVLLGDADADGYVTVLDATAIERYLAKLSVNYPERAALCGDVNGDGLSILDATAIQRYLAKLSAPEGIGKSIE